MRVTTKRRAKTVEQFAIVVCMLLCLAANTLADAAPQPLVQVDVPPSFGPRPLEDQTRDAVVRDYLKCWKTMSQALQENNLSVLDSAFTGIAKEKLAGVISQQQKANLTTSYRDGSHHLRFVFYSPEGLSIQLLDDAEYDVEVSDRGKTQAMRHVKARYVAVLTPTEVSWKVRILQADAGVEDNVTAKR
jgi:hypothetical protein